MIRLDTSISSHNLKDTVCAGDSKQHLIQQIERIQNFVNSELESIKNNIKDEKNGCISISIQISESRKDSYLPQAAPKAPIFPHSTFAASNEHNNDVQVQFSPSGWCSIF